MRRGDLLRKGVKMVYDHTGKLVKQTESAEKKLGAEKFSQETANEYFHLKSIEKYYFKWHTVGADMRVNLSVVLACIACFSAVYFPAIWYEDRHLRIELLATIEKDVVDLKNYDEYLYRTGKKTLIQEDTFREFSSI